MDKYLIWGTGNKSKENYRRFLLASLNEDMEIVGFIDNNERRHNDMFHNIKIYAPADICGLDFDFIDIWVQNGYDDIKTQINTIGIPDKKIVSAFRPFMQKVINRYRNTQDVEINSFLDIMGRQKEPCVYAYNPVRKDEIREAFYDGKKDLYYVIFEEKRLYLAKNYRFFIINGKKYVRDLWQEQDLNSPHLYEEGEIAVEEGDVVVDAGACEGNFSLHNIDKISKLYLIECDLNWMEALRATFEPYQDKVVFCSKFLSGHNTATEVTLNSLVREPVNFLKLDIEGEEVNALKGSNQVFAKSNHIKCAVCSYHRQGDEEAVKTILHGYGLKTVNSKGYMLFLFDDEIWRNPELRRGVVRGIK